MLLSDEEVECLRTVGELDRERPARAAIAPNRRTFRRLGELGLVTTAEMRGGDETWAVMTEAGREELRLRGHLKGLAR